jgi:hypothetical protein
MTDRSKPRYPIYIPSKGRWNLAYTARFLAKDNVPFSLVVEPDEEAAYRAALPDAEILVLPGSGEGSSLMARNWIHDHSIAAGYERHWQLDDNMTDIRRLARGYRIPMDSGVALRTVEDFSDRYTNIGVSGLNYQMFVTPKTRAPFVRNVHVYSCTLINNLMPYRYRLRYNEDTDLCLQVLAGGHCTVAFNIFHVNKLPTGQIGGGNEAIYKGDGRARMARTLEREWPYVVETKRRYGRPQHVVRNSWRKFDTPLIRRTDIDWDNLPKIDEYGMAPVQVRNEVRSDAVRALLDVKLGESSG